MRMRTPRTAFTLLELLIVVGVIGILMALALAVGARVAGSGKQTKTADTIKALDVILNDYVNTQGGVPPPTVLDPRASTPPNNTYIQPIADAVMADPVSGNFDKVINSVGLFLVQARDAAGSDSMLKGINSRLIRTYDPDGPDTAPGAPDWATQPELLTAFDGWDRPIRYVHPKFGGLLYGPWPNATDPSQNIMTQDVLGAAPSGRQYGITMLRRNRHQLAAGQIGDSDGGTSRGGTPYFYSAGPDGDPSTLEDNVYSVKPEFPKD